MKQGNSTSVISYSFSLHRGSIKLLSLVSWKPKGLIRNRWSFLLSSLQSIPPPSYRRLLRRTSSSVLWGSLFLTLRDHHDDTLTRLVYVFVLHYYFFPADHSIMAMLLLLFSEMTISYKYSSVLYKIILPTGENTAENHFDFVPPHSIPYVENCICCPYAAVALIWIVCV